MMTPQPPGLRRAMFRVTASKWVGPRSSAIRKPPPLLNCDTLRVASESDVPLKSTPTSPLCWSRLCETRIRVLRATRIASNPAFSTVNPLTSTLRAPKTTMPLPPGSFLLIGFWPRALMVAPWRPISASDLVTTACTLYVPPQTTTRPPLGAAAMATLMWRYRAVEHERSGAPEWPCLDT